MKRVKKWVGVSWWVFGVFFCLFIGCRRSQEIKTIDLNEGEVLEKPGEYPKKDLIKFAIGAMLTPGEGYVMYKDLVNLIGEELGRPIQIIDRQSYAEINNMLESGDLDAAFVCSGPYVIGHDRFGLELIAAPQAYGKAVYHSYIIVPANSPAKKVEHLRGKTFAFVDPNSNTGCLAPTYLLSTIKETPDSFFQKTTFTYAHDKSIMAVAEELADGAAVDSLIWDYANQTNPRYTSKTRIIWKSPPYGIPPVAASPKLDPSTKAGLKKAFLKIHETQKGKQILEAMMIDKFVETDDRAYDTIRDMLASTKDR